MKCHRDKSDAGHMPTDMLEYIRDVSQYHLRINSIEEHYKIHDNIKKSRAECKGAL